MKAKRVCVAMLIASSVAFVAPVQATGIPVVDVANLMQGIQQFFEMIAQLEQLEQQYEQQVQQYRALTGGRNMGSLFNSGVDQQMRQYAPSSWQQALQVLQQGGLPGNAADVARASQAFAQSQGFMQTGAHVFPASGGNNADALAYTASTGATAAAAGLGQAAYDQTPARMRRVQDYLNQVNNTADLKASVDLNARLLVEMNEALTQLIQLQAAQMQVVSSSNAALLHGKAQDAAFTPYNVP